MHGMLKRAAASAIPALLGLAVSPASAMAAPHTGRAVAGPVMGSREVHERLAQLPRSGIAQLDRFTRVPGSVNVRFTRVPGSVNAVGAPADGIIADGHGNKIFGNHIAASAGTGINVYHNIGGGNYIGAVSSP
jgi:hypothetical protein